jgi:hypothetical protein
MSMICQLYALPDRSAREVLADPSRIRELINSLDQAGAAVSLEKSWHGLHFALTGSSWGGEPPLNFLATGGEPVGDVDVGYGPARILMPDEVALLSADLERITDEEFARRFDLAALTKEAIYPEIWDEPLEDLLEEYLGYLGFAKALIAEASRNGQAMLIVLS